LSAVKTDNEIVALKRIIIHPKTFPVAHFRAKVVLLTAKVDSVISKMEI